MPWADTGLFAPNDFANAAGVFDYTSGIASSALAGRFARMSDACGAISLSSPAGILAFGGSRGQHDCATPGFGGAGNTAASRTTFYELNRIKELARGWLPANTWLQAVLDANVNIAQSCAAFWNGTSVSFYRSGAGCRNTGEIAGTVDHEWGHGMDRFDTGGVLSNSSEGYGDIAAMLRSQSSCIGYGFFQATSPPGTCGLTADGTGNNANEAIVGLPHCDTDCSGVRDGDWARHSPPTPDTALGFVCSSCTTGSGPCGRQVHCAAAPARQAAWDLAARDLPAAPFNLDRTTSFIIGSRLFYQGSGLIGTWHACTCGASSSGCGATNAYMQWLATDDDNGNLADGTPHMTALFAAFDRHGIACATPPPVNSGCAGGPSTAPGVSITGSFDRTVLSWTPVPGATRYWVFRADGHAGCDQGKALIAEVTGLTYTDFQVASGHWQYYNVVAAGASNACFGPASGCLGAAPGIQGDFDVACTPAALTVSPGGSGASSCTVQSTGGFAAAVELSCAGLPANADCAFDPAIVAPPANGTVASALTMSVGGSVPLGTYNFFVYGESGGLTRGFPMTLTVSALAVAPQALAVDAAGNGVYQPNETVAVAPTWRNTGTQALALTGALTNHTGPAGPTYTIPDAAGSYGTIAAGGSASCTVTGNCYSVANSATTRPTMHWDSAVTETVTPTSTAKTWTLHVGSSFTDVPPTSPFFRFIETLLHRGVTGGCSATTYCPGSSATREQMAVFVLLSKEGPGYVPPACVAGTERFGDVPASSPFCRWIEELSDRGVVSGCGGGNYCPTAAVTREQMAVFVLRTLDPALNPPPCAPPNLYLDVPETSPFCRWIEELTNRGVVSGCGGGNYCPAASVTREQMGVFLTVTFGLTLYGL